jgi:hypothetical protein
MGEKAKIRVSYSSLATFESCPRKFEFQKIYPKVARNQDDNYAADVGKALHAGYQEYLTSKDRDSATWQFMLHFPFQGEFQQSNDYRNFDASLATLDEMMDYIQMDEFRLAQIKKPDGTVAPAIEVPFEIEFKGIEVLPCERYPFGATFSVIGYIDAIMQNLMTNHFRTVDVKTSRMKLNDSTGKFKFDGQQVPYGIVVEHVSGQPVESFEVIYFDCYIDLLEPKVNLYKFLKTGLDIQEWGMNKVIQFQQIAQFIGADYFPRTDSGCMFYNSPCRFLEPCQSRDYKGLLAWFGMDGQIVEDDFEPWIKATLNVGD